jgi:hypothetical protein
MWAVSNYIQTAVMAESNEGGGSGGDLERRQSEKVNSADSFLLNGAVDVYYRWDVCLANLTLDRLMVGRKRSNEETAAEGKPRASQGSTESAPSVADDVVIAGYGSHPASWAQWTFETFYNESTRIATALCTAAAVEMDARNRSSDRSRRRRRREFIWYGAPAWPKPKLVDNFRATNLRLGLFNSIAVAALQRECTVRRGVPLHYLGPSSSPPPHDASSIATTGTRTRPFAVHVLDLYALATPVLKHSKDGSHFDGTNVVATLADWIFRGALCR